MFLLLLLFIILFLLLSGGADASPLLAGGNTVTGYVAVIVTFAALIALGIFFGKRDRARVKADLLGNHKVRYVTKDEVSKKGKIPL